MNLTKLEKTVIIILVVGGILAAGIFFFIVPAYKGIETANNNLDNMKSQRQAIEEQLAREATIDDEIADAKKEAETMEGDFYPDLTTYEAVEITLAYLRDCDMTTDAITVSPMSTSSISLDVYTPVEIIYDLKTYSAAARGTDENALLEGQFLDGNKRYTISVGSITDITIADAESGEAVEVSRYTETMKDAYKEALCRYAVSSGLNQTIGATTVSFTVKGTYENYLKFIDYVFDIERATYMNAVVIPMTHGAEAEEGTTYVDEMGNVVPNEQVSQGDVAYEADDEIEQAINFVYYSVEPMEALDNIDAAGVTIVVNQ
ncbi:MAG: YhcB family protein [Bacteroides sp.]|nr:YhcB family protein [Eubacterium sp.]MCM1417484.1 YhcB family protein [Roseburia sp.]MCM1462930.1 YhcB family protein [Bacteroides sp.]